MHDATPHKPRTRAELLDPRRVSYARPPRECDVVMKGGITSGIVYPLAVCELAPMYRFRSVGGTSAGALAAAVTAAAEFRRRQAERTGGDPGAGFRRVAALPDELARDGRLGALFQPGPATADVFAVVRAALGPRRGRSPRLARAVARGFGGYALSGATPGLLVAAGALLWLSGALATVTALLGLVVAVLGGAGALAWAGAAAARDGLLANGYGLCSGATAPGADRAALTPWLATLLDETAGITDPRTPLTLGDLWRAELPKAPHGAEREREETRELLRAAADPALRTIDLQMMTTNLTHGRPYRLPFDTGIFYFRPDELRALFPRQVVDWMIAHPRATPEAPDVAAGFHPLPAPHDLPVVVAARLSMSFPGLLSAVPLHARDYTRTRPADQVLERCWFSDGGICSNFPVHFFDAPLPRRPTFALNLDIFHPDYPPVTAPPGAGAAERAAAECENVWMPRTNNGGRGEQWHRFDAAPPGTGRAAPAGWTRLAGFAAAVVGTARDWHDNAQRRAPGYRDRVAHVPLTSDEGGLNLDMPAEHVQRVSERGRCAGELLWSRFAEPPTDPAVTTGWDNHRWVRYRSSFAVLHAMLRRLRDAYRAPSAAGDRSYAELIARRPGDAPDSYPWRRPQSVEKALAATESLMEWVDEQDAAGMAFDQRQGAPAPVPELRIVPRV